MDSLSTPRIMFNKGLHLPYMTNIRQIVYGQRDNDGTTPGPHPKHHAATPLNCNRGGRESNDNFFACRDNVSTLQRQNAENLKQMFPEKEYRGRGISVPISTFMCLWANYTYIPTMGLPFLLEEICRLILGIYKSLTDTWMWQLGLRPRNSQKMNI